MTQRSIEIVVGRLATDEDFRNAFLHNPRGALEQLCDTGMPLTDAEIAALVAIDPALWMRFAEQIDPRLQKASLKTPSDVNDES